MVFRKIVFPHPGHLITDCPENLPENMRTACNFGKNDVKKDVQKMRGQERDGDVAEA